MVSKLWFFVLLVLLTSCKKEGTKENACQSNSSLQWDETRNFKMGFTTWPYGPNVEDIENTYQFITNHSDIYSQQIDNKIPWKAWINNTALPTDFVNDIAYRISKKPANHQLLLSVSLLNIARDNLLEDYDGTIPVYSKLYDQVIEDAYFLHLKYLVEKFNPTYLIVAMEVNELWVKSETKWNDYKILISNIRSRIKNQFPTLQVSESVTLHNWFKPGVQNPDAFISALASYVNQLDFVAISFYPFIKGFHTASEFQQAFDFLHSKVTKPIAFSETGHLAEDLEVAGYNLSINSDVCEQKAYLETLLFNAQKHNYKFIIWWTHRDYDRLWETFPAETKDLGKLWKDTGLWDENGKERPAAEVWDICLKKTVLDN